MVLQILFKDTFCCFTGDHILKDGQPYTQGPSTSTSSQQLSGFMMQVLKSLHIMRQTQQLQSEQLMMITDMLHHVDGPPAEPLSFAQFETLQEFLAFEKELTACEQKRVQLVSSCLRCTLFIRMINPYYFL
ncbi:unnamed protein product [Ixodes pacificus]